MRFRKDSYKYLDLPQIGTVLFKISTKAKRVIISIKSDNQVVISVPKFISFKKAESFVSQKIDWIKKHQKRINNKIDASINTDKISDLQKNVLLERIDQLSIKYNLMYNKVTFKRMKTRWGSCSQTNNISLNIGLVTLPSQLRDYVILHELVHTRIKDHSHYFWKELSMIIPNAKQLNRELNKNYKL